MNEAYYDIRRYTSDDFEIRYQENWTEGRDWWRRWDKHPRDEKRTHYHSPPDAGHPPKPATFPGSSYEILRYVDEETLDHTRNHPLLDSDT